MMRGYGDRPHRGSDLMVHFDFGRALDHSHRIRELALTRAILAREFR